MLRGARCGARIPTVRAQATAKSRGPSKRLAMSFATLRRSGNFIQPTKEIVEWKQTLGDEDADLEVSGSAKLFSKGAQERRKFIDKVLLQVHGGRGGSGCTAFDRSRSRYGPPSGADGGDGGDVFIKVGVQETNLRSINRFHIKGVAGQNGSGQWRRGGRGDDVTVLVPRGTVVKDITDSTKDPVVMADLDKDGATIVVARGGTGGRGNATLSALAPQERAKKVHDKGTEGEMRRLQLELKLIADVALVGFPNAGKSTFLAAISNAQPKIASYPFTTLHPTVGVVEFSDYYHFTVADLPGLIEGAHLNVGLGHQFLRHVERTKVLCFVLDMAGSEGRLPWDDFKALQSELEHYQPGLSVIVANKMDLKRFSSNLVKFSSLFPDLNIPVFPVAANSRRNLRPVMRHLRRMIDEDSEAPAHKPAL